VLRVLGQVGASFIIAEGPDGMFLIDQHAAHERVMYEKILAGMRSREESRQPLLDPLVVDLAPDEMAAFEKSVAELAAVGWEIEPFAAGAVAVRSVPAPVRRVDLGERLHLILRNWPRAAPATVGRTRSPSRPPATPASAPARRFRWRRCASWSPSWSARPNRAPAATAGRRCSTSRGPIWRSSSTGAEPTRAEVVRPSTV
jgi:hypothetical protein